MVDNCFQAEAGDVCLSPVNAVCRAGRAEVECGASSLRMRHFMKRSQFMTWKDDGLWAH